MNYVGRLLSNFKGFYNEINSATLTGAIDVIIVKQKDGTYLSSPFHVRFGKMGVLHAREKVVDIEINGEAVDLHMKLGEAGEAFFVQEEDGSTELPEYLATSPIPSALDLMESGLKQLHKEAQDLENEEKRNKQINSDTIEMVKDTLNAHQDLDNTASERSLSPLPPLETEVGTQTGTPPFSPRFTKEDSESSIVGSTIPKKDSQQSLYHSVHTSFDKGSDEEKNKKSSDEELGPSRKSSNVDSCLSDDDSKSDRGTQTDMTGEEVLATLTRSSPSSAYKMKTSISSPDIKTKASSSLVDSTIESPACSTKVIKTETVPIKEEPTPTTSGTKSKISSAKKKRRKEIERKRREMHNIKDSAISNVNEQDEVDNSSTEENLLEESMMFDIDFSHDDLCSELAMSRTVSMPLIDDLKRQTVEEWASSQHASAFHPFSDGDITPILSPVGSRPPSPKSDTEYETQQYDAVAQTFLTGETLDKEDEVKWKWGELPESTPRASKSENESLKDQDAETAKASGGLFNFMRKTKKVRHNPEQGGIYLEDLNLEEMDPEVAALYIYHPKGPQSNQMLTIKDEDSESGRGGSLPQSPVLHEHHQHHEVCHNIEPAQPVIMPSDIAMSLCGGLKDDCELSDEKFNQYLVTFEEFGNNPALINNPNLVIRIAQKYYNWHIAGPLIMSMLIFRRSLPEATVENLVKLHMPKKDRKRGWIWWRTHDEPVVGKEKEGTPPSSAPPSVASSPSKNKENSPESLRQKHDSGVTSETDEFPKEMESVMDVKISIEQDASSSFDSESVVFAYRKSLRLTSEQIEKLNLQDGVNDIAYSVTTQYQGTCRCTSSIYLWDWDDRIIISDIDGTITKSDVLGQILPMVGKDWSQAGIASLYNAVHRNGYKFLYLSARAIGQSKITRDYLRGIRQGEVSLPDGPLLLSPSSLISAFHREVIERKPEEFKISCLKNIAALFPERDTPFYAGFGNKVNDVWAYRAVGIPMTRIFTVNHKGELKMELNHTFQSSYTKLSDITDHFFPPLVHKQDSSDGVPQGKVHAGNFPASEEYSTFTYWREPLPDIEIEIEAFQTGETSTA